MTAYVATTNQTIDEVGFQFYAPIAGARTVYSSLNGQAWTTSGNVFPAAITWTGYDSGDGLCVYVAANRTVGITTTPLQVAGIAATRANALPAGAAWTGCVYGNGAFVTVNTSSTSAAYLNPRAGTDWAAATLPSAAAWSLLAFGNGVFVTVAPNTTSAATSSNGGATWGSVTLPASLNWSDLEYANGFFVLVANGSRDVYTSPDGANWTLQSTALPSTAAWTRVDWISFGTNGTWVAVSSGGSAAASSTDNGVTWTSRTMPASGTWIVGGGKNALDGRQMFVAIAQASVNGAFSYDGVTWVPIAVTSATYGDIKVIQPKLMSGDSLTINNGATLTVNTTQTRFLTGASALVITNGTLSITNSSTSTPIRFGTGRLSTAGVLSTIQAASGLSTVDVQGNWIEIGTSSGAANQAFTSPYTTGDYIPAVWVETGSGTGVYEPWTNVTGAPAAAQYNFYRNGLRSVGSGDGGTCFTQGSDSASLQYIQLSNCNALADTNVIGCTSTAGLEPGTWLTGRGLAATTVVQDIIDSTKFTVNFITPAASAAPTAGFTNIPMIGIAPNSGQFSTTLTFGNGVNGKTPPSGARIRVQNIMLTDYSSAVFNTAVYSAANAPCYFTSPAGGVFKFNTCIMGESYSNFLQAGSVSFTNVGGTYVPWISECYQVSWTNVAFGLPPVHMVVGAPTALGATGSTNSTTTVTTPATNAIIPGVLLTGTNLHACTVSTVSNSTTVTVSTAAFGTTGSLAFSYYGPWVMREHRMMLGTTSAAGSSFTTAIWSYVSNLTINGLTLTFGGHHINNAASPTIGGAFGGLISTQYSNNVTVNNLKGIQVGSYPKTRAYTVAVSPSVAGANQTYSGVKLYNISGVLSASNVAGITVNNITMRPGINNEGYNWASACRVFTNPSAETFLSNDTQYWFKTRSYRTNNFHDTTGYVDSMPMCAVMSNPVKYLQMPQRLSAVPTWSTTLAPTLAYGSSTWVALNGAVSGNTALVSEDNGATWTSYMMPVAGTTMQWWKVIWCPTNAIFVAFAGGGVATTLTAYSTNGKDWSTPTTAPASAAWQALAYDNTQASNKIVAVSGGAAVSTAGTYATITNGSIVYAASTLVSAQWIDVVSNSNGRFVAIAGGSAVGTATAYSTNGSTWTAGGANASSLWQSIAFGNGAFVCISSSAVNGPTAVSADAVAWTAGTAPSLPTGMTYNKVIWTGSQFVLLAGPAPLAAGGAGTAALNATASQCYVVSTANTGTTVTWGSIKYLPDFTYWVSMVNNGNAVGVISTQTGRFCYTADITAGTPTWTQYSNVFPTWNRLSLYTQAQEYTTGLTTAAAVASTKDSNSFTCTSTAMIQVGTLMVLNAGNCLANGGMYLNTATLSSATNAAIVTGITNATTFTTNKNALKTASGMTATFYRHGYQVFRSTSQGFTARDGSTLIGSTLAATAGQILIDDTFGVALGTTYYYRVRKLSGGGGVNLSCSGTASSTAITTAASFLNWQTSTEMRGVNGNNVLTSLFFNFFVQGVIPGSIVTGTGIPSGTTVIDVPDFDTVILSANLTADVVDRGASRTTVGFSPAPGMYIFGSNVGADAKVSSVTDATNMVSTVANTNTFTTQNLRFVVGAELPEVACIATPPVVIQNNAIMSGTLSNAAWVASNVSTPAAGALCPLDNFVGIVGAAPAATSWAFTATAANGTLTQAVQTGVGVAYTFSCYARARHPDLRAYLTMKMDLGTATNTHTLTNQWARYSTTFTTTSNTTNAVFTLPAMGTQVEVAYPMVTLGSSPTVPTTVTAALNSVTNLYFAPQQTLAATNGLAGHMYDAGSGIETTLNTAPTGQIFAHLHVGTSSDFVVSDQTQVYSTETTAASADCIVGVTTSVSNVNIFDFAPVNTKIPFHQLLLNAVTGSTSVNFKNIQLPLNGTTGNLYTVGTAAYSLYFHNVYITNYRNYVAAVYFDGAVNNASGTIKYQNVKSNNGGRVAWNAQSLDSIWKGAPGANTFPAFNATSWNLSTTLTQDSLPLVNTSIYDSMFHEYTWGQTGKGCLDLRMVGSSKTVKPYTVTGGSPYFDNAGNLFFQTTSDQIVIEWPHIIRGVTGFSERMPHIYGTDVGLSPVTSLGVLVEYDLDVNQTGYSNVWKVMNGPAGLANLAATPTVSAATGFRIKFRLTARSGLKYAGQSSQFVVGETIQNASSNPTATAVVVADEVAGAANTGTLVVSNITGEWVTTNTIYSSAGATRATITATNTVGVFFPQPTSKLTAIRIFTDVNDGSGNDYPYVTPTITFTGLVTGTDVVVLVAGTGTILAQQDSNPTSSYSFTYNDTPTVDVGFIKQGYVPLYIRGLVLTASNSTLPVAQTVDRNYL